MMLKAVAFDAFGTLVRITEKRAPYAAVARAGRRPRTDDAMTMPLGLEEYARRCGAPWNDRWSADLETELASIRPYEETFDVLAAIRAHGLKTAVASNLALPYGPPLVRLVGHLLDVACLSYEVGAVKPDAAFYAALCRLLDCAPDEILMVGDTWRCDYEGAVAAGLHAAYLDREGTATPDRAPVSIRDLSAVRPPSWEGPLPRKLSIRPDRS